MNLTSVVEILVQATINNVNGRSDTFEQVWHFAANVAYSAGLPSSDALCSTFATWWNSTFPPLLQQDLQTGSFQSRYLDNPLQAYTQNATASLAGAVTTARLPSDVSVRCLLRTQTRGKSYKGGKSFRPIPEAAVVGDELTTTAQTLWNDALLTVPNPFTISGTVFAPCVVSRVLSQTRILPVTIVGALVSQAILNISLGTVKGRHRKAVR